MVKIKSSSENPQNDTSADQQQQPLTKKKAGRPRQIQYALEKKFTLLLPKELHRALKIKSAEHDIPMTSMIIEAIKKTYGI